MSAGIRVPRQARSEATLDRIVRTTMRLVAQRGTVAIPVREICEASETSKSSFYARFPNTRVLHKLVYDRFAERALSVADEIHREWPATRPGGDDLPAFVHAVIERYARFCHDERSTLQAFRAAEPSDRDLEIRRLRLDRDILGRCIDAACFHYPRLDRERLETSLDEGIGVIAAAARGAFDFPRELSIASALSRDEIISQVSDLVVRYVPIDAQPVDAIV